MRQISALWSQHSIYSNCSSTVPIREASYVQWGGGENICCIYDTIQRPYYSLHLNHILLSPEHWHTANTVVLSPYSLCGMGGRGPGPSCQMDCQAKYGIPLIRRLNTKLCFLTSASLSISEGPYTP
jgi:hypothetical protein